MSSQSGPASSLAPAATTGGWAGARPAPEIDVEVSATEARAALTHLLQTVPGPDDEAHGRASAHLARLASPPGALGHLAQLSLDLACLTGHPPPVPSRVAELMTTGDHGVVRHDVTPSGPGATHRLVAAVLAGRAGSSAAARAVGARLCVLDVGLAQPLPPHPALLRAPVVRGTADLRTADAMTVEDARRALVLGARAATGLIDEGTDLLVLGHLGVGAAAASEALVAAYTGIAPEYVTARPVDGGADVVARRREVIRDAVKRVGLRSPLRTLAALGGTEHAALVGAMLAAAGRRVPVVLDGLTDTTAAMAAIGLAPDVGVALLLGNLSPEPAARLAVGHLGLRPLLDLDVGLGDGTGGLLAVPLLVTAARLLHDVATLDEIGLRT